MKTILFAAAAALTLGAAVPAFVPAAYAQSGYTQSERAKTDVVPSNSGHRPRVADPFDSAPRHTNGDHVIAPAAAAQ